MKHDDAPQNSMFAACIDSFVPPRVRAGDPEVLGVSRLVVVFGWALIFPAIFFAIVFFLMNSPIGCAALVMAIAGAIVSQFVMRWTGSCLAAGNLLTAAFFGVLTVLTCRLGGQGSLALPWYAAVTVVALNTAGRRSAIFWLAVTTASLAAFYALGYNGYSFPNDLAPHHYELMGLLAGIGLIVVVFSLAYLYEAVKVQMLIQMRRSQAAVAAEREQILAMFDGMDEIIYVADPETHELLYLNGPARAAWGNRLGEKCYGVLQNRDTPCPFCTNDRIFGEHTGRTHIWEFKNTVSQRWYRCIDRAIRWSDGRMARFEMAIDIDGAKRAEQKLRREKQLSDDIIKSLPGLFYIFDQQRFVRWNEAWETVTGYSAEELEKMHGPDFFEGADKVHVADRMQAVFREGAAEAEAELVTKDGKRIPYLFTGIRSMLGGAPCLVGLGVDITEHKRVEQELEQYAAALEGQKAAVEELCGAAEAASQAKSEFLANVSHEIRTPLTAVLGFADVILDASREPQVRDAATTIKRNGQHLLGIISDILDLSKVEAGKLQMDIEPCRPCQIVADVVSLMRVQAEGKGLSVSASYSGPIPETIETDAARLRQILLNLVGNAVKFTEVGGVELRVHLVDGPDHEPRLQFDVVDTGIGMTDTQTSELFRPFHQVDTSATRRFGGTGLGLAISKRLAEMLGGYLTVESELGQGSTFSLAIATGPLDGVPMSDPTEATTADLPQQEQPAPRPAMPKLSGRILLAEDGPDNQRLISFLLKKAGAEVVLAENGQEALEKALAAFPGYGRRHSDEREPIDLILMDIQMPVMDGLEATRLLREAGYDCPILALTAHAMKHDVRQCLNAGCDAHLAKPIEREKFIATVARFLEAGQSDRRTQPEDDAIHVEEDR